MRRRDREVTSMAEIRDIMDRCPVCRLGLVDSGGAAPIGEAYIVPMNFGYVFEGERLTLYFHGAREGRKADLIRLTGRASFEMDGAHALIDGGNACEYGYAYECVMGTGAIEAVEDEAEKAAGLDALMRHLTGRSFAYDGAALKRTAVFKLSVETVSAKRRPLPHER